MGLVRGHYFRLNMGRPFSRSDIEPRTEWSTRKSQSQEDLGSDLIKATVSLWQEHVGTIEA